MDIKNNIANGTFFLIEQFRNFFYSFESNKAFLEKDSFMNLEFRASHQKNWNPPWEFWGYYCTPQPATLIRTERERERERDENCSVVLLVIFIRLTPGSTVVLIFTKYGMIFG